jgi:polynucleotide 5'-hydroxyl-kinase GRC3/NOL9
VSAGRPPADGAPAAALAHARAARVVLVLGASDTGKTSLVDRLAGALVADGRVVAVVDADLGQSVIGPPTTVGLGRLRGRVGRLADAEVTGLCFVGATSPRSHFRQTVLATRRMTERALREGADHVIVDTSGLVQGEFGRRLKLAKIAAVAPELVVCLEREGECEHIVGPRAWGDRPVVLRLPASPAARHRSPAERRRHRERAFAAYFTGARTVTLDLGRVRLYPPAWGAGLPRAAPVGDVRDVLAGLDDARRRTLGLGLVRAVEPDANAVVVETPVPAAAIAAVRLGARL